MNQALFIMTTVLPNNQVTIKWSRTYNFDNVFDKKICLAGSGVYCLSMVTSSQEIILYVGMTDDSFYARMSEHAKWMNLYLSMGVHKVSFGTVTSPKTYSRKLIEDIEGGLIYQLQPIRNKMKKNIPTRNKYIIMNVGSSGLIPGVINMEEHKKNLIDKRPLKTDWDNPAARRHPVPGLVNIYLSSL